MCSVAFKFHCSENNMKMDFNEIVFGRPGAEGVRLDISGTEQRPVVAL
jgi:urease beta subunit